MAEIKHDVFRFVGAEIASSPTSRLKCALGHRLMEAEQPLNPLVEVDTEVEDRFDHARAEHRDQPEPLERSAR